MKLHGITTMAVAVLFFLLCWLQVHQAGGKRPGCDGH